MKKRRGNVEWGRLDHRKEFDEVWTWDSHVHIERMDEKCYWIGIYPKGQPSLRIFTGDEGGRWFFNLEEDKAKGGKSFYVSRPSGRKRKKK